MNHFQKQVINQLKLITLQPYKILYLSLPIKSRVFKILFRIKWKKNINGKDKQNLYKIITSRV